MRESRYNRPLTVAFSKEDFESIKQITDTERISLAEWIRIAVEKALTKERS